jgi:hypothetical protein
MTVTRPYGMRMNVRTSPRATRVRCMRRAKAMPSTNSMATDSTVMTTVAMKAFHQNGLDRTVA